MKNFRFDTICNIIQEPQELQRFNCAFRFISKSAVIKYHQLLPKVKCIIGKSVILVFMRLTESPTEPIPAGTVRIDVDFQPFFDVKLKTL